MHIAKHTRAATPCLVIALALLACGERASPGTAPGNAYNRLPG